MKLICKIIFTGILTTVLCLTGCAKQADSPLRSFLEAGPEAVEYRMMYRYTDPITERIDPHLSGWLPADPDKIPDEGSYVENYHQFVSETGHDTIIKLQEALHTAALKETDKPTDEKEINYMVRLPDETVYSFYRNGYIKFVNGDERHIYAVESSAYDELMKELDAYIPFWTTPEFRADMFPDS